ncbi:MAG: dihydrofolate reductase family protein, partial [Actinomycetota bacterium]
ALREAGIEVEVGTLAQEVAVQLRPYLHHRRTGRPEVTLKLASTLDGKTAAPDGSSQWITSETARADAHGLRADVQMVIVGAGTVRADDPQLTVRLPDYEGPQPLRLVLGTVPEGAKVLPCRSYEGALQDLLDALGDEGILSVLIEGGANVASQFHTQGLVDRYVVYLAPAIMGGSDGRGLFEGPGAASMAELWRGEMVSCCMVGEDLRVEVVRT